MMQGMGMSSRRQFLSVTIGGALAASLSEPQRQLEMQIGERFTIASVNLINPPMKFHREAFAFVAPPLESDEAFIADLQDLQAGERARAFEADRSKVIRAYEGPGSGRDFHFNDGTEPA